VNGDYVGISATTQLIVALRRRQTSAVSPPRLRSLGLSAPYVPPDGVTPTRAAVFLPLRASGRPPCSTGSTLGPSRMLAAVSLSLFTFTVDISFSRSSGRAEGGEFPRLFFNKLTTAFDILFCERCLYAVSLKCIFSGNSCWNWAKF